MTEQTWGPDTELIGGFERLELPCRPDAEGPVRAVLVRKLAASAPRSAALLYIHGYNDYFFNPELADWSLDLGFDFYALDLRKYGRSLLPHQTHLYVEDLSEYFEEIDAAVALIRESHERLVLTAHSTGGLTASLWAQDRRNDLPIDALLLNAPFFSLNPRLDPIAGLAARLLTPLLGPKRHRPEGGLSLYALSLHSSLSGEWDYRLDWKCKNERPLYLGWVRAVTAGHRRIRAGLDIPYPILTIASARSSSPESADDPDVFSTDVVLPTDRICELARTLGPDISVERIDGAVHDVLLSRKPVREAAYTLMSDWLRARGFPGSS